MKNNANYLINTASTSYSLRLVTLLLIVHLITACGAKSPPPLSDTASTKPITQEIEQQPPAQAINTALYQQGLDALALNDLSGARKIFQQFIDDNPRLSGPYTNLALIEYKQEHYKQASKLLDIALSLNPEQAAAFHLKALIHLQQGEILPARDHYLRAIEIKPDYKNAHYNLALLYDIYLQEIELAIQHYTRYLSLTTEKDSRTREWVNHLKNTLNNG
jgi:tetratricopeptide (TPR) repeat protein